MVVLESCLWRGLYRCLYRENAIAIESEANDSFGGNVYNVTMQITLSIPEFNVMFIVTYYTLPPIESSDSFWMTRSQRSRRRDKSLPFRTRAIWRLRLKARARSRSYTLYEILLAKLQYYGIHGTPLELLKSYLTNRKQYVEIEDTKSKMLDISTGVPQGSILGPLLFIIT